jgi:hypothetical protein
MSTPLGQINSTTLLYTAAEVNAIVIPIADATGTVNAITGTFSPALTLTDKMRCMVVSAGANTSSTPTFAPDGLTAHTIVKKGGQALVANDIALAGSVIILEYNSANTRWELLNPMTDERVLYGNHANVNPTDSTTYYFGSSFSLAPTTTQNIRKMIVARAGTIVSSRMVWSVVATTAGGETSDLYLRLNGTTDYLIASGITFGTTSVSALNDALNIPVVAGDYLEFKWVTPGWATNPTGISGTGRIVVN